MKEKGAASLALIRQRFEQPGTIEPVIEIPEIVPATLTPAAVLIPLVLREDGLQVLLTRRTDHLLNHPGQISFPGGRAEPGEVFPLATALRETEEETGIKPESIEPLGTLPEYCTGTGFRISPVVGVLSPPFTLAPDPFEVAEIFEVPLAFLINPANIERPTMEWKGKQRRFYAIPYGDYYIWGATAGMLVVLGRLLAGSNAT